MKLKIHCDTPNYVKACCKLQRAIQIIGVITYTISDYLVGAGKILPMDKGEGCSSDAEAMSVG